MKQKIKYTNDKGEMKGKWKTVSSEEMGLSSPETFQRYLHGGYRLGAGRKLGARVQYTTRLQPSLIRKIKSTARKFNKSECEIVELWLKKASARS